jgi:hypothetical protein
MLAADGARSPRAVKSILRSLYRAALRALELAALPSYAEPVPPALQS